MSTAAEYLGGVTAAQDLRTVVTLLDKHRKALGYPIYREIDTVIRAREAEMAMIERALDADR